MCITAWGCFKVLFLLMIICYVCGFLHFLSKLSKFCLCEHEFKYLIRVHLYKELIYLSLYFSHFLIFIFVSMYMQNTMMTFIVRNCCMDMTHLKFFNVPVPSLLFPSLHFLVLFLFAKALVVTMKAE